MLLTTEENSVGHRIPVILPRAKREKQACLSGSKEPDLLLTEAVAFPAARVARKTHLCVHKHRLFVERFQIAGEMPQENRFPNDLKTPQLVLSGYDLLGRLGDVVKV